jgi:hypothetical protein
VPTSERDPSARCGREQIPRLRPTPPTPCQPPTSPQNSPKILIPKEIKKNWRSERGQLDILEIGHKKRTNRQ